MKRIVAVLAGLLVVSGCGLNRADEFRSALPSSDMVTVQTPADNGGALTQGQRSEFYTATHNATAFVNFSTVFVLELIKAIVKHDPTTVSAHQAVWGPYKGDAGDGLSPANDWKLTVDKVDEKNYTYKIEAKGTTQGDDAWVTVLSGSHKRNAEDFGAGTFMLDWDAAQTLPQHGPEVGTATVTYSRETPDANVTVDVDFENVKDDAHPGQTVDAAYKYKHVPNAGGTFDFKIATDLGSGANEETLAIRSRWMQTGAGRSDIKASGGDLGDATPTINECWNTSYNSVYQARSYDSANSAYNYGSEDDCAFSPAEYSAL